MAKSHHPDRLTNTEAMQFRKLMLRVMGLKGLSFADVLDALMRQDENKWDDSEQKVRNALKLGPRPILAPNAIAIWRAVALHPSRQGVESGFAGASELLRALVPERPAWWVRYGLRQAGPGVLILPGQVEALAEMIATKVAQTRAARRSARLKIEALLKDELTKMSGRWLDLAEQYMGVIATSASRGEYIWQNRFTGKDVIRQTPRTPENPMNHDVSIVTETIALLAGDDRGISANHRSETNRRLRETVTREKGKMAVTFDGDARAWMEPFMTPGSAYPDPLKKKRRIK